MSLVTKQEKKDYGADVFQEVNKRRTREKSKMVQRTIKIYPEEKEELQSLFDDLGLEFNSGIRFALKEFKRNHLKNA